MSTADYVTNGPISGPIYLPRIKADIDLGGLKFSYQIGLLYTPTATDAVLPIRLPPPFEGST